MGVSGKGVTVFCGDHPNFTPLNNFPWSVGREGGRGRGRGRGREGGREGGRGCGQM